MVNAVHLGALKKVAYPLRSFDICDENPREFKSTCGFDDAKEQQLLAMLQLRDVHKYPYSGEFNS